MIKITDKSVSQNVYPRNFSSGTFSRNYYYYYYYYYIYIYFLKTARTSVQGKDDVLILRVNV